MSQLRIVLSASLSVLIFSLLYQVGRMPAMADSSNSHSNSNSSHHSTHGHSSHKHTSSPPVQNNTALTVDCNLFPNDPSCVHTRNQTQNDTAMSKVMPTMPQINTKVSPPMVARTTNNNTGLVNYLKTKPISNPVNTNKNVTVATDTITFNATATPHNIIDPKAYAGLVQNNTKAHSNATLIAKVSTTVPDPKTTQPETKNETLIGHAHICPDGSVADANAMCMGS